MLRASWRCPVSIEGVRHEPASDVRELTETPAFSPHETIEHVRRLTGTTHATCPLAATRDPFVHEVLLARKYRDSGQLAAVFDMPPPAALIDAMGIVDAAVAQAERAMAETVTQRQHQRQLEQDLKLHG